MNSVSHLPDKCNTFILYKKYFLHKNMQNTLIFPFWHNNTENFTYL